MIRKIIERIAIIGYLIFALCSGFFVIAVGTFLAPEIAKTFNQFFMVLYSVGVAWTSIILVYSGLTIIEEVFNIKKDKKVSCPNCPPFSASRLNNNKKT